jgi:hypothetical protein
VAEFCHHFPPPDGLGALNVAKRSAEPVTGTPASGISLDRQLILAWLRVSDLLLKIFGPKDLPDLDGVAFVRRAALRPLHHFFLGRRL